MSYWKRWERFNPLARVGMIAGGVVLAAQQAIRLHGDPSAPERARRAIDRLLAR